MIGLTHYKNEKKNRLIFTINYDRKLESESVSNGGCYFL